MRYRREIDGLRAVAVLPVILFHAGFELFSGGFVGVDVFFVISGYLITSIILAERLEGTFTLAGFYERRARRILPALFFVMFTCLPFAWLWMYPSEMQAFSESLMAVSVFLSNILFWSESGYFDAPVQLKPLLHTWSLAIEEQYYLLFPVFLLLTWRLGKRWIVSILAVVAVVSLATAQWGSGVSQAGTFYLLPTRIWELLIGVLIAFFLSQSQKTEGPSLSVAQPASLAGILLIAFSVFAFDESTPFPSVYALLPTLGTALIILFATPQTVVGQILSSKSLVGIGLISYSAYLWHQPLFAFARLRSVEAPSASLLLLLAAASIVAAYFSWKYVEMPFRRPSPIGRRGVFSAAVAVSAAFFAVGYWGHSTDGYEQNFADNRLTEDERQVYRELKKHTGGDIYLDMGDNGHCNFWARNVSDEFVDRFDSCSKQYGKAIVVVGDSHAMNIYNALYRASLGSFLVGVSQGACRPANNKASCHYDGFKEFLIENQDSIQTVIFHQSGSYLLRDYAGETDSEETFAGIRDYTIDFQSIRKTAEYLDEISPYASVVWLGPFAEARFDFRDLREITTNGYRIRERVISIFGRLDSELEQFATQHPHEFKYVSLHNILQIEPDFLKVGDCVTYRDADHFSSCGEEIVGEKIRSTFLSSGDLLR